MKTRYPAFPSTFSQELCLPDSKLIFFCSLNFIPGTLWDGAVVFYRWRQKCGTPKAFTQSQWGPEVLSGVLRNWGLHDVPACPLPTSTIEVWCFGESRILLQALDQIHAGWALWCFGDQSHGVWDATPMVVENYPHGVLRTIPVGVGAQSCGVWRLSPCRCGHGSGSSSPCRVPWFERETCAK